ncbi:hypothetical protein A5742_25390 [Mycolicibacterium fortuitum]|uniref:Uncharacterized protein n=1 Tax=Mycolicibacterium fortuitum TaxID=1766 RepID=A0ABD6QPZ8_MYCFO|nr:hypothetical protein [Mycolicibacterium fortuitum]OMC46870.1 hypothetical protein A5742_25390 [Mycolicibacterium fortuitum]
MRLRGHHIRKIQSGWLVQSIKLQPGDKPSQIVDDFTTAAAIALPAEPSCIVLTDVRILIPNAPGDVRIGELRITPSSDLVGSIPALIEAPYL